MKVGFIGLGVMGGPMALNVLKQHELTVYDRSPEAVARLVKAGAKAAATPKEVGAASDIVVTMLPEPQHVEQVVLGAGGVAEGLRAGGLVIDMSTIDPQTSRRVGDALRARGMELVDSPVGKTSEHAATGTLTLMVGGNKEAIERAMPVLKCMGTDTFFCGGPGTGHAMKITNNLLATTIMMANTEALAIGVKSGLTLELMQEVMRTTMAWNQQFAVAMPKKAFIGDDSPGFAIKLACKDVRLACDLAQAQGFEPLASSARRARPMPRSFSRANMIAAVSRSPSPCAMAFSIVSGQVFINCYGAGGGVELPFGGTKRSGHGREKGLMALEEVSTTKTVASGRFRRSPSFRWRCCISAWANWARSS